VSHLLICSSLKSELGTVIVVEYGPLAQDDSFMPLYNNPAPKFMYNLTSVPQIHVNNRTFPVANGAVVGGGSAVNGQFFDRGSANFLGTAAGTGRDCTLTSRRVLLLHRRRQR
jgi:choline dehydrogenase-like flavoprotein